MFRNENNIFNELVVSIGFPGGSAGKESASNVGV